MKLTQEEHLEPIRHNLGLGMSYVQIAELLGCGPTSVRKFVNKYLPELRRQPGGTLSPADLPERPSELELLKAEHARLKQAALKHRAVDVQAELLLEEVRAQVQPADVTYE